MPSEVFELRTLTRVFTESGELMEVPGLSEVSVLGESERDGLAVLAARARRVLEDPELSPALFLHRRRIAAEPRLESVEMTFEPPRRSPEWQEPVRIRIDYARWEADALHHAFVPALGIHVLAARADLVPGHVQEHVRLVLGARDKQLSLLQLAELDRIQSIRLGAMKVTVRRSTPLRLSVSADEGTGERTSVLAKLAEQLPPALGPDDDEEDGGPSEPVAVMAFELESELRLLAGLVGGPNRRSVLLVGPPGSGKTALIREFARRREEFGFGQTPFWTTTGARLMAGPAGFGMWQERCRDLCREAGVTRAIVHFGNLADLIEVGRISRGGQSVGGFLRPWIARGELVVIAECTPEQLGVIERNEPHLAGAFDVLTLAERTSAQARSILGRVFEAATGTTAGASTKAGEALDRLHQLHLRYATYSARPGRALRFLRNLLADQPPDQPLDEAGVIDSFSRETGLPAVLLDDRVALDLDQTREWFSGRVIGQPEAVERVLDLLATVKARLGRPRKPLGCFLFIGPTGSGKTEMAKALAECLFGDPARMVRFDLNEFSDPASVERLIGGGAARGDEGLLTARVREQPFGVVLLDEFEKADPSLFDLLLQVLGEGRLTDGAGRVADFCNSVIVLTSNLGAEGFQRGPTGFRAAGAAAAEAGDHFTGAVRRFLRPELFNRFDAIVPFRALGPEVVLAIARRQLALVRQRDGLRLRVTEWELQPGVAAHVAAHGYDAKYGARPLKRAIEREVLIPLSEALNQYAADLPLRAEVGVIHGRVRVTVRACEAKEPGGKPANRGGDSPAGAVVRQRRIIGVLRRSSAVGRIEDDETMLSIQERRAAAAGWAAPDLRARFALRPRMRDCLRDVACLAERIGHLETETLGLLYRRQPIAHEAVLRELSAIEAGRRRLLREVLRFQFEQPDEIVLAVFAEPRAAVIEFVSSYLRLAAETGHVESLECLAPAANRRGGGSGGVQRMTVAPSDFLLTPPERVSGVVMRIRGELAFPRFAGEAGLQLVRRESAEHLSVVTVVTGPAGKYRPPDGIERPGAIKALGAALRRTFVAEKCVVRDSVLGERPWSGGELTTCLSALMEERLEGELASLTR